MNLSKANIKKIMIQWAEAWNRHDLNEVMKLFHEDVVFENWSDARVKGKDALQKAWTPWFENHGDFQFILEDLIIDDDEQKVIWQWCLEWPSLERGYEGKPERRRGLDIIHFRDGKIIEKYTYSKTTIEIDHKRVRLFAVTS